MAKQHISLGSAPADEPCAQLGTEGYEILAWDECSRYVTLLQNFYAANRGVMPASLQLKVVENPHDFGVYLDVIVEFDTNDTMAINEAIWLDNHKPAEWPV